ncbi:MAG: selenide, water dikinase SelD [Thiolinea sp.]
MIPQLPLTRELVLVGGGHTHALVLRKWAMCPLPGARLTVINPEPTAPYSGMLPGFVAGHYRRDELNIDLVKLARFAGARVIPDKAVGIDPLAKRVLLAGREPLPYDLASVDVGIHSAMPEIKGFTEYAVPVKPLDTFSRRWSDFLHNAQGTARLAVIGAGVAGIEITLAMAHALRSRGVTPEVVLLDSAGIAGDVAAGARAKLLKYLADYQVKTMPGQKVAEVLADGVLLDSGEVVPSDFTLGTAGARPHEWVQNTGLKLQDGYIVVDEMLRSSDASVYAAGDCVHIAHAPRPKAGVYAVRAAPVLWHNLRAALSGGKQRAFHPQQDYLKLMSLGGQEALAEKFGMALAGPLLWRWKNQIDQKFMAQFRDYPAMNTAALPDTVADGVRELLADSKPLCGGCGAKVGRQVLSGVLAGLPQATQADVSSRPGDDAAILRDGERFRVLTTDHLRAFTEDPATLARIAAVHALGDIWAMGAQPQTVLATLILPRMSAELQERWLTEIMSAAAEVFSAQGAEIVGGHTSLGSELTIGFTINGVREQEPVQLSGGQAGDVLILSKPLGTGTLLAAEMAMQARGEDVVAALHSMQQDQAVAAAILHDAHAMTDVTGFGLAGHLLGVCEASNCAAQLELAAIPLLAGAAELAEQGIRSSLFADNRQVAAQMVLPDTQDAKTKAMTDLLFDPQTAGGLLAAVSADAAADKLAQLKQAGYPAAIIGTLSAGEPLISVA